MIPAANVNAIAPARLLDTRDGALVTPSSSRCVAVPGAADGDVVVVNITNTRATGTGWGALRSPSDTPVFSRPTSGQYSSVNFAADTPPNPNLSLAMIDGGEFCYDGVVASHHVTLDLAAVIPAANVNAITPTRLLDTRAETPSLDTSFGDGGRVAVPGYYRGGTQQVAVQSDGKIVMVGGTSVLESDVLVVRFNIDGSLDATFGDGGIVTADAGGRQDVSAMVLQPDGKIVVTGRNSTDPSSDFFVMRFNGDGTWDTTFGGDGIVTTEFGADNDASSRSLDVQSDGKIVVTGSTRNADDIGFDVLVVRFNIDGSLDSTFGENGSVSTDFGDEGG